MAVFALSQGLWLQAAFHLQQAIEKTLKGYIVLTSENDPPYTHDLVRLADVLVAAYPQAVAMKRYLAELNPYYIRARYPSYKDELRASLSRERIQHFENIYRSIAGWHEADKTS